MESIPSNVVSKVLDAESPNGKFEYEHKDAFPNAPFWWFARDHFIATCDLISRDKIYVFNQSFSHILS